MAVIVKITLGCNAIQCGRYRVNLKCLDKHHSEFFTSKVYINECSEMSGFLSFIERLHSTINTLTM